MLSVHVLPSLWLFCSTASRASVATYEHCLDRIFESLRFNPEFVVKVHSSCAPPNCCAAVIVRKECPPEWKVVDAGVERCPSTRVILPSPEEFNVPLMEVYL